MVSTESFRKEVDYLTRHIVVAPLILLLPLSLSPHTRSPHSLILLPLSPFLLRNSSFYSSIFAPRPFIHHLRTSSLSIIFAPHRSSRPQIWKFLSFFSR
ncbi:hypothetical protein BVRB_9g208140 [Beta vulgaris subsp. vulgaris]|nr:hypothetical protein BVRB_9g208140 [Beta vulgaris subsp. vulgaris]